MSGFDGLGPLLGADSFQSAEDVGPDGMFAGLADGIGFVDLLAEHERLLRDQMRAESVRQWNDLWGVETRQRWSGPDKLQRQILRAFRVTPDAIGLASRSVFSSEYRRRQRARVKRRRR